MHDVYFFVNKIHGTYRYFSGYLSVPVSASCVSCLLATRQLVAFAHIKAKRLLGTSCAVQL